VFHAVGTVCSVTVIETAIETAIDIQMLGDTISI
jgi:hypothetical protein